MVGWHHQLNGHEFEWAPGVGDGQGSLACCSPWGSQTVRHDWATELNWTDCEYCCDDYLCTVSVHVSAFSSFGYISKSGISGSNANSIFNLLMNCQTVFHSGGTGLHSHQKCRKILTSPHLLSLLTLALFWFSMLALCWEDPLEEGKATHSSILAWRIPWTEQPGGPWFTGLQRVEHDLSDLTCNDSWCWASPSVYWSSCIFFVVVSSLLCTF